MVYHILNGDALAYSFPDAKINGRVIVTREALLDGDLSGDTPKDFWKTRAKHHQVSEAEYHKTFVTQIEALLNAPNGCEFNLWFEYDLFCQVNMWYILSVIDSLPLNKKVFAVYTTHLDRNSKYFWNGYGPADSGDLQKCYADRTALNDSEISFGKSLWHAYKTADLQALQNQAESGHEAFPYLREVIKAHLDRFPVDGSKGRPERVIEDIIHNISPDFNTVFTEFWKRESIYGFGDTQLKTLYNKIIQPTS